MVNSAFQSNAFQNSAFQIAPFLDTGSGHGAGRKKKKRELPPSNQPYRVVPYPYPEIPAPPLVEEVIAPELVETGAVVARYRLADAMPIINAVKALAPTERSVVFYSDEGYRKYLKQLKDEDDLILEFIRSIA